MHSLGRFLLLVVSPIPRIHEVLSVLAGLLFLFGIPVVLSELVLPDRLPLVLGSGLALSVWAGVRLQLEKDKRNRIDFHVKAHHGPSAHKLYRLGGTPHTEVTSLRVTVFNDGPTAEFVAKVTDFGGAVRHDGKPVVVAEVAWEHNVEKRYPIERDGQAPLRLAEISRQPKAMWFWTAKTYTYGAADGHAAGIRMYDLDTVITFMLSIHNVDADKTLVADAVARIDDHGHVESFEVTERRSA